jgi:hypothetical protein
MHRLAVIVASAMILMTNQSQAQTRNNLLRGLSEIEVLIEELDAKDKECGLTKEALRASVMYPLSSSKLKVVPFIDVIFYLGVDSLYLREDQLCFSNVRLSAYAIQHVTLEFSGDIKIAEVTLWKNGFAQSSNRSRHARNISDGVEEYVKKFITDWNLDNKPTVGKQGRGG